MQEFDYEEIASTMLATSYSFNQLELYSVDELEEIEMGAKLCGFEAKATMGYDDPALLEYFNDIDKFIKVIQAVIKKKEYEMTLPVGVRAERVRF